MKPLTKLCETLLPNGSALELWERDGIHLLLADGQQVASSFFHGSDDAMARLAAMPLKRANQPAFLLAGLNLGFVLSALQEEVNREKAHFVVAEPNADLVAWHRKQLADLHPGMLDDPRVTIEPQVALAVARKSPKAFHAILIKAVHTRLHLFVSEAADYCSSLKEGGLLIISVPRSDPRMEKTLQKGGFQVSTELVPASHKGKQTSFHTLIIAKKGRFVSQPARRY